MKTTIYLLPGTMCDERLWNKLLTYLNENYELIFLEIPKKETLNEICDYLFLKIKEKKINLLGFSLGAYIAAYFASKYPKKVSKLFLMSNTPCDLPKYEIEKRINIIDFINSYGIKGLSRKKVQSLLGEENQENDEIINLIQNMYITLGKEVFIQQLSSTLKREDLSKKLASLDIDITFFYALNDELISSEWIEEYIKISKNAKIETIKGSSHMLPLEKPFEVSNKIITWLEN